MGEGIQVERSEAVVFGMEITNAESPAGSKRCFADTESTQTPPKRQKRMDIATPVVQVRRMAVV